MASKRIGNDALSGLLIVDKPLGLTSMEVVRRVRRAAGGAKTGHAGTLDPLATGVVVCCLGRATRLVEQVMSMTKVYEAEIDLSAFTRTDDREGEIKTIKVDRLPNESSVKTTLHDFVGTIDQKPPAYSAVHVSGQRAYKLARKGQDVDLPTRKVRIDAIELLDYHWPIAAVRVTCGRGTYIRSIARDLGARLDTGGHLASLRRTAVGPYTVAKTVTIEQLHQPLTQAHLL